ncbi:23S rRNA (guanosine(2251)-2'-O)-methyltransferase RlmB [Limnobacter humi]|uniref:23S rRNA (guanosine-2'-O-)-methyltransferase RlmB n=1 Tax=Limnobacter humi TaxID=1778671 RepID=A0ABT1WFR9_9BURK|nr:23S rRNA (guanosine(2251)-2'-O)-methyltransferase RlmB [Limnobacter humi]
MAILYGFHAVLARLKTAPSSVDEVLYEQSRKDKRMQQLIDKVKANGVKATGVDAERLEKAAGHRQHQGVVAFAKEITKSNDLFEIIERNGKNTLLLVLDGVTDPHNLGACLRSADAAGVQAVVIPKDKSVGITPVVSKVACGAAETLPVIMVTNLARTLEEIQDAGVWCIGAAGEADGTLYDVDLKGPVAWVMGAEGDGLRRLTRDKCDQLIQIPMVGSVESLNVSVASSVCLFETLRQRQFAR